MDPKALADLATKAMAAIKDQDGDTALTLLEQLITLLMGGAPADDAASSSPDAATAEGGDAQPAPVAAVNAAALSSALCKVLGVKTEAEAIAMFSNLRTSVDTLRTQANGADLVERRGLIAQLVKMGVETPATAWAGDAAKLTPCSRLLGEPLDEMKARVLALSRVSRAAGEIVPPIEGGGEEGSREIKTPLGLVVLSAREIENCESAGAKLETYAHNKAIRERARVGGNR